jgi:transposase
MALYAGIDLHSSNSVLALVDAAGAVCFRRRYPNELSQIVEALTPYRDAVQGVVVESTYNWYWLVDGLQDAGYRVHLANTAAVPQYDGLKHGDDHSDAAHLANLLRLGILPEGYIYPRAERGLRDLLRRRMLLVQQGVRLTHSVQSLWARHTGERLAVNAYRRLDEDALAGRLGDPAVHYAAQAQHQVWEVLQAQIHAIERYVCDTVPDHAGLARLRSTPGIGVVLGLTILLETGPIQRFAAVGDYASYCRLVDSKRLSNGKVKGHGNRKCGNRYLAWAYVEAANFATRFSEPIRRWHQRKAAHAHPVIARKAVAHKLARSCYHVLRDDVAFDVQRAFG